MAKNHLFGIFKRGPQMHLLHPLDPPLLRYCWFCVKCQGKQNFQNIPHWDPRLLVYIFELTLFFISFILMVDNY